jgi:transposase-like protein
LDTAQTEFDRLTEAWSPKYPGAAAVWQRSYKHAGQLFDYCSAVHKAMYTTNANKSVNPSFRKVTEKGASPSDASAMDILYLCVLELNRKWAGGYQLNWAMVRNQLACDANISARISK